MRKKVSKAEKISKYMTKHPNAKAGEIADALDANITYVYNVMSMEKKRLAKLVAPKHKVIVNPAPTAGVAFSGVSGARYEVTDFSVPKPNLLQRIARQLKSIFA